MVFSLIILVLIGVAAYFHYLQGFFSATISAILAAIAAMVAVGYHEAVANLIGNSRFPDFAASASMVLIFAAFYIVMRVLLDTVVPGNVRFSLMVDRIGAAVMGVVAGVFSVGVFAIAAQALPFGPTIAGFCRYPVTFAQTLTIRLGGGGGMVDAVYDQLDAEKFVRNESGDASGLWIPADSLVLKLVNLASRDGGSLDCGRSFEATHPDFLQELFGQRVGIQTGSRHTAASASLEVNGVFLATGPLPQDDPERWTRDGQSVGIRGKGAPALPREYKPGPGKVALVVRVRPESSSADSQTNLVAFTPASARLVANRRNYFPLGTLEGGRVLYRAVVDDPLFVPISKGVDLVYEVPEADLLHPGKDKNASPKIAADVFVEFKRSARASLGLKPITKGVTSPGDTVEVVRKEGGPAGGAQASTVKGTLVIKGAPQVLDTLSSKINLEVESDDAKGEAEWGTFALNAGAFSRLEVNPVRTVQAMEMGRNALDRFSVPEGQVMVQLTASPAGEDKWKWADALGEYEIEDGAGKKYKPNGAFAKVNNNGQEMMTARYDAQKPVDSVPVVKNMRPTDVVLLFLVPKRSDLKFLFYKGELMQSMQFKAVAE